MTSQIIELDFGQFTLKAELFETEIAKAFAEHLPYQVQVTQWGRELYGTIGKDLGVENPVSTIPPGGLAYTNQGNYVCIFYGRNPAWAVEYIGHILEYGWEKLVDSPPIESVIIRAV